MPDEYTAEKKSGTILFCDIRNFTTLFENTDPIKAIRFANNVLARLGEEIEAEGGTVDRFTGDGFMAHFGIKKETKSHMKDACNAALNIRETLKEINNERYRDVESILSVGVGVHSGMVAYGEIKTNQISQITVLGSVVNIASRVETLTKYFSVDILVSQSTYTKTKDDFLYQSMPTKKVKGIREKLITYWLLPMN